MPIKQETVIRTIFLILALTNQILTALGRPILPLEEKILTDLVATLLTAGAALWAWWKNNSFTAEARQADQRLEELRHDRGD